MGIDEAQFFDDGLIELVGRLADSGLRVVVAGLDLVEDRVSIGGDEDLRHARRR